MLTAFAAAAFQRGELLHKFALFVGQGTAARQREAEFPIPGVSRANVRRGGRRATAP